MNFKQYVRKHGGYIAQRLARRKSFPAEPEFKELRSYMLGMNSPDVLQTELEQLRDEHLLAAAVRKEGAEA
jgi:hypothetical protein